MPVASDRSWCSRTSRALWRETQTPRTGPRSPRRTPAAPPRLGKTRWPRPLALLLRAPVPAALPSGKQHGAPPRPLTRRAAWNAACRSARPPAPTPSHCGDTPTEAGFPRARMSPGRWVQRPLTPPVACSGPVEGGRVSPHPDLGVAAGSGPGPKPRGGLCSHPRCASPSQTSERTACLTTPLPAAPLASRGPGTEEGQPRRGPRSGVLPTAAAPHCHSPTTVQPLSYTSWGSYRNGLFLKTPFTVKELQPRAKFQTRPRDPGAREPSERLFHRIEARPQTRNTGGALGHCSQVRAAVHTALKRQDGPLSTKLSLPRRPMRKPRTSERLPNSLISHRTWRIPNKRKMP